MSNESDYSGIHCFLDQLHAYDISAIFGNPGTTELPLNDALLRDERFQYHLGIHEIPVMAMADGYTQASQRVSCINLHTCCGLGNAMGMIYNAQQEGTPLIITAGQQDQRLRLSEPVLAGDLVAVAKPWTKWAYEVTRVEDLPIITKRAVQVALTPPRGPVFLSLPLDVQMATTSRPDPRRYALTLPEPGINSADLDRASQLLASGKSIAILAGSRVTEEGGCQALAALAQQIGAPIFYESPTSHGRLPVSGQHPLLAGPLPLWSPDVEKKLQDFDVCLAVGINLFRLYLYFEPEFPLPTSTRVVHLDSSSHELGKNHDPDVAIWGPIAQGLTALHRTISGGWNPTQLSQASNRAKEVAAQCERLREQAKSEFGGHEESSTLTSHRMMAAVVDWAPRDLAVIEEAVTTTHQALTWFQTLERPDGYFGHRGWALGWGAGFACGVQLAWPDRPVLAILGDGSTLYGLQALWSAQRYRLPVTFLIANNRQYKILKDGAQLLGLPGAEAQQFLGMDLTDPAPDFATLARGFGLEAHRATTEGELRDLLNAPLSGQPRVIEAMLTA